MLAVTVTQSEGRTEIRLAGTIDHTSTDEFARAFEQIAPTVCLDLRDVKYVSSYGIGLLIRHLSAISRRHRVEFARCSEAMVDQFQMLQFSSYGRITSFMARYACSRCNRTDVILLDVGRDLKVDREQRAVHAPEMPCSCGGKLSVDDSLEFVLDHVM